MEPQEISQKEDVLDPDSTDWLDQGTSNEQSDLAYYNLTREREKRSIKVPSRYGYADIIRGGNLCTRVVSRHEYNNILVNMNMTHLLNVL